MTAMKNKLTSILSMLMALTIVFNIFAMSSLAAPSKSELEEKIDKIQAQREEKQKQLEALKGDVDKQEEYVKTLYEQIEAIQTEIDLYQEKIDVLNDEVEEINVKIEEVEAKMADKKAEIQEVKELLAVRIRATYMAGNSSTLKLLFSAGDLASYLTTSEMIKRIAANDDKMVASLSEKIKDLLAMQEELEKEKENLESKKAELEAEQKVVKASQDAVNVKYKEANEALEKLDKQSAFYREQILALDREEEKISQQIQEMIAGGSLGGGSSTNFAPTSNPSGYINPVPYSDAYISSGYGMRTNPVTGVYKMHAGIDISCSGAGGKTGPFTKKIVAAKDGTVSHVGWISGYGETIMITHSDGYITLYAHNYQYKVSVGQKVIQGQQIAIMGTTGNSTGAHCHFEIRNGMWGTTLNPALYI